jgi:hypothetical protein
MSVLADWSFERTRPYANMLVDQSYRLMEMAGTSTLPPQIDPDIDLLVLLRRTSDAHNALASFRSSADQITWERSQVDGRFPEYIFEELTEVLARLLDLKHESALAIEES